MAKNDLEFKTKRIERDETKDYRNTESERFEPKYKVMQESFNLNPLSSRSCRCYPCRC